MKLRNWFWLALALPGGAQADDGLKLIGDFRFDYATLHRDDRDGSKDTTDEFRTRLRIGLESAFGDAWSARIRAAGKYTTAQQPDGGTSFYVRPDAPTASGLDWNEGTIDEAYVQWAPSKATQLRLGRQQVNFALDDVQQKSLDKKDSSATDVTWTDGLLFRYSQDNGWRHSVLLQHNDADGTSNYQRPPLDFEDSSARVTWFYSLDNTQPWGVIIQRALDLTYIADGLKTQGTSQELDNYSAVVGRLTAAWPLNGDGFEFRLGGEAGHAFDTPTEASLKLGTQGDTGGNAYYLSGNLMNFTPGHSLGLVYGRADAGWLISPDFQPNGDLIELRWVWALDKHSSFESRVRRREDLDQQINRPEVRVDKDFYIRYTYKL